MGLAQVGTRKIGLRDEGVRALKHKYFFAKKISY